MEKAIGVAVVGCGYWGVNHIRVFNELPEARLLMLCDQQETRLHDVGRRFPGVALTTSLEQVLSNPGVDAVVVSTGATTHYAVARACLEAGKHVLVEKPLTRTVAEAERLVGIAEARERVLMVGHTFLYNSAVRKVKELVTGDEMGRLYYLYATRTNLGPIRTDVNALWDLAPHDISIFNYLLGSTPEWVSAVGTRALRNSREDSGFISLGYPGGITGHLHVSWVNPNKVREVVIVGSKRRVVFDDISTVERVRVFEKGVATIEEEPTNYGEFQLQLRDGDIISPRIEISEPLKNECRHFMECVALGRKPLTSGWEGLEVVQVMETIDRSVALNGAPQEVPTRRHTSVA